MKLLLSIKTLHETSKIVSNGIIRNILLVLHYVETPNLYVGDGVFIINTVAGPCAYYGNSVSHMQVRRLYVFGGLPRNAENILW